ncbi:MAG: DUF4928 family protein [Anaerolineae bacterium]
MPRQSNVQQASRTALQDWLDSCTRDGKVSRNTVAIGIVVLHHLRQSAPLNRADVISRGGEIKGARSGLRNTLSEYGIPPNYLREVTTRQAHQDAQRLLEALDWGIPLSTLQTPERDALLHAMITTLAQRAQEWLTRQNLKLDLDRRQSPEAWIGLIIESAKERSGGVVEQHLVGAKLQRRFAGVDIPNHPAHAGDEQTDRPGDFAVRGLAYHVTANPGRRVIEKCADNIRTGKYPILLVPNSQVEKARALADVEGIKGELSIISIESFVAMNVIEISTAENKDFVTVLKEIVEIYNRRLGDVETDLSLQIEIR